MMNRMARRRTLCPLHDSGLVCTGLLKGWIVEAKRREYRLVNLVVVDPEPEQSSPFHLTDRSEPISSSFYEGGESQLWCRWSEICVQLKTLMDT